VDTTGAVDTGVLMRVAQRTDLFLYDIKTMDAELHLRATGVPLRPVLENLARLLTAGAKVRVRIPLIPGVTDADSIDRTGALLASMPAVEGVDLLPFHASAKEKHSKFGMPWLLESADEIPAERVDDWARRMVRRGLAVTIGG
jgi:pyruvate formate lyase activating enzyme